MFEHIKDSIRAPQVAQADTQEISREISSQEIFRHPKINEFKELYRKVRNGMDWNMANSPSENDLKRFRALEARMDSAFLILTPKERLEACRDLTVQGFLPKEFLIAMEIYPEMAIKSVQTTTMTTDIVAFNRKVG